MNITSDKKEAADWRIAFRQKVLEGDTPQSKLFDVILLLLVLISVTFVILETVKSVSSQISDIFVIAEWFFTIIFTIEYLLRVVCAEKSYKYIFSIFGLIDLVSILPLYISLFVQGEQILQVLRLLRLIRIGSRLTRASYKLNSLSKSMLGLSHHLREKENMIMFFRPSRKRFLSRYLFIVILIVLSIMQNYFGSKDFIIIGALVFSFFYLLKVEYNIWSERYGITNERILNSKGIIQEHFQSMTYAYVTDISLHQSVYDKIFNIGDLTIKTASGEGGELRIKGVSGPLDIKRLIDGNVSAIQSKTRQQKESQ